MNSLAILGAGGHGKVIAECAELSGWNKIIFFDDAYPMMRRVSKWNIEGTSTDLVIKQSEFDSIHVAIGDNLLRNRKIQALENTRLETISHPSAAISCSAKIESGTAILANAVVNADVKLGRASILNSACVVEHDCKIHEFVHICPGAKLAGNVTVGKNSLVGIGSSVIQNISIGKNTRIGAGSVVISNIPDSSDASGVPCKVLKRAE